MAYTFIPRNVYHYDILNIIRLNLFKPLQKINGVYWLVQLNVICTHFLARHKITYM